MPIALRRITHMAVEDYKPFTAPYTTDRIYRVRYTDSAQGTVFETRVEPLEQPATHAYDHFDDTYAEMYNAIFRHGFSWAAWDGNQMVGLLIGEPVEWNGSLRIWEFHVAAERRGQGIGRILMETAAAKARAAGLRTMVVETQNQNYPGICAYRALGFRLEGIDISYYTNEDYPNSGIAIFLKRRIEPQHEKAA